MAFPLLAPLLAFLLTACTPDSLREHTADVTAAAKRNAAAMMKGIYEGLARKGPTNINKASANELQALPGITPEQAQLIKAGRPYDDTSQLVRKHILSASQYNKLRNQMIVK